MSQESSLFALNVVDHPVSGSIVGVIAKRTYQVRAGRCAVADEQVELVREPRMDPSGVLLLHDTDAALNRTAVDVIVSGKVHAPAGARQVEARVRAGSLDRRLLAFGERRCFRDAYGQLRFTQPEPLEPIDVGWGSAYGGVDQAAVRKYGDPLEAHCKASGAPYDQRFGLFAYPRNRAGRGFLIEASDEGLELCRLPHLEEPSLVLVPERLALGRFDAWPGGPPPAALSWLAYNCFPRMAMLGIIPPFDAARFPPAGFFEVQSGVLNPRSIAEAMPLPERMDVAVAQQSALGMRAVELGPEAPVELSHLHQREPRWAFALSAERPEMYLQLAGSERRTLAPRIRTLVIEPELDRVSVVWVGEHHEPTPVGPGKMAHTRHAVRWA